MKKRYIVYGLLIVLLLLSAPQLGLTPVLPVIQLPGEVLWAWPGGKSFLGGLFGAGFTNTFLATLVTFVIVLIMAFRLRAKSRTANDVPSGFYNFFEMLVEMLYGYVENAAGTWNQLWNHEQPRSHRYGFVPEYPAFYRRTSTAFYA